MGGGRSTGYDWDAGPWLVESRHRLQAWINVVVWLDISETAPVPLTMWQPEDFLLHREHPAYLGRVERIDTLSGSQLASLRRFYNLYRPAAAEWPANCVIEATAKFLHWAWAGPLALEAGKWFLSRPASEDPTMWFGRRPFATSLLLAEPSAEASAIDQRRREKETH
ncbi:hypothetical protein VOLCADRAFT_107899 [Volvox carteri f. nagariensis]|uniref:Uncharacterized protein n=1 Tax=Volvox carteri f. nagariensis TaxID=3068 RepID=D8UH30_VOLCA|nr:uncharacterized protein VOLCADRAFT_107899 [Volvox carteri f. nagariensis]EFJ40971.1 hypothetical protein VOLCADRAFT_107899 [Volvox carteri f. nagariensis]|eukprot:XP_002957945.1 hypothetical protein VOLCADRAFT_107899 [Volvox carteri f. nagariensis]